MKIHSRYVFDNTVKLFLLILSLLISIVWFTKTISFVRYITDNGIAISQFFYLFILILPSLLIYMIPISLFIAAIIIVNRMLSSNEVSILRNSGLSDIKISAPIIKLSIYLSLICLVISMFLLPYANKNLSITRNNMKNNYANIGFSEGVFESLRDITIFVNKKSNNSILYGIILNDNRNKKVSLTITAKEGRLGLKEGELFLYMTNGTVQRYVHDSNQTNILEFDSYIFNLSEEEKIEKKKEWKVSERYPQDLLDESQYSSQEMRSEFISHFHKRIAMALLVLAMTCTSLSIMLGKEFSRRGSFSSIVTSIVVVIMFFGLTISLFKVSESNLDFIYVNYAILTLFIVAPLYFLKRSGFRK